MTRQKFNRTKIEENILDLLTHIRDVSGRDIRPIVSTITKECQKRDSSALRGHIEIVLDQLVKEKKLA